MASFNVSILFKTPPSAFMTTQNISIRNQFSRLYVDYLIVDEDYNPILSIELDGHYHKYTQDKDKRRDELLKSAGIPVIRFKEIPDIKVIRKTISRYI
jgi:very-short-patch-repair endonuclease